MLAIITGHSRGLGAALAAAVTARGGAVLGVSRRGNAALAGRIEEAAVDFGDPAAVLRWLESGRLEQVLAAHDGPAVLINNAGVVEPVGPAGSLDPAAIARAVAVNVTAPLLLADAFIAATAGRDDRRVLHISSGAARTAYTGWSIYCATKAALDHHARAVAADEVPGLRIASVAPGVVDTDMQASIRATTPDQFRLRERFVTLKETGGLATPEGTADRLLDHLLGATFGDTPTADVREMA